MAEKSFFFTAVSGAPAYTAGDFVSWMYDRLFRKDGVLRGLDNALAVTADGSGNALVNTGAATKTGHGYQNTASLSKALTLPTIGKTNINTVVIRVDSGVSPNTMHAVVLTGTSVAIGNTPVAPAITAGTDVYLADIRCTNTAGTYSFIVTDKRVYSPVFVYDTDLGAGWSTQLAAAFSALNVPSATTAAACTGNSATATQATNALACSGNSATATSAAKLTTARTITISGDATGSTSFDGSGNVTLSLDVTSANTSQACSGNAATATYATSAGSAPANGGTSAACSGNAATASRVPVVPVGDTLPAATGNNGMIVETNIGKIFISDGTGWIQIG